jgi:hypothetical protein
MKFNVWMAGTALAQGTIGFGAKGVVAFGLLEATCEVAFGGQE